MGKIKYIFWRNRRKVREFYISFIGSLFSGTAIGIFFAMMYKNILITSINKIDFINIIKNFLLLTVLLLGVGWLIVFFYSKKDTYSYFINYLAGLITSPFVAWLIIFKQKMWLTISIATALVAIFFFVCYGISKVKRSKNIKPQPHKPIQN